MEVYVDGGCKNNPGQMRIAVTVPATGFSVVKELGNGTNNKAEYLAIIYGLIYVKHLRPKQKVFVYSDSNLVVNQLKGYYKVKSDSIKQLHQKATKLLQELPNVTVVHIPRESNPAGFMLE